MEIKPVIMSLNTNYTHANRSTSELELRLFEDFWDTVSQIRILEYFLVGIVRSPLYQEL